VNGGGSTAGLRKHEERDGADGQGLHVSERGERRQLTWKMQTRKAKSCKPDPCEDSKENLIFQISVEFGFWQDLRISKGDLEEIWTQGFFFLNSSRLLRDC
jgi:hypothetical protein